MYVYPLVASIGLRASLSRVPAQLFMQILEVAYNASALEHL
jgi:hypothetical protein